MQPPQILMGYYTIRLDLDASKVCTVIFPWGKYSYKRLPMGIAGSPDIFQEKMSKLMETIEFVRAYLDDLLCISKLSLEDHQDKLLQQYVDNKYSRYSLLLLCYHASDKGIIRGQSTKNFSSPTARTLLNQLPPFILYFTEISRPRAVGVLGKYFPYLLLCPSAKLFNFII